MNNGSPTFDKIYIITDRKYLDVQLGNTLLSFLNKNGISNIARSESSEHLSRIIQDSTKVIITTLQKFCRLVKPENFKSLKIAIVADEAHRGHGHALTRYLHSILTGDTRQTSKISYFSFTCTPSPTALKMFGKLENGVYKPIHIYSTQEAIEDGVIMDVLEDYVNLASVAKVFSEGSTTDVYDRGLETLKMVKKESDVNRSLIHEKAYFIVNHFINNIEKISEQGFIPKAMIVVKNRKSILVYKEELEDIIKRLPEDKQFNIICAFSAFEYNKKNIKEKDQSINGPYTYPSPLEHFIKNDKIKMVVVADKLRTGFDYPQLSLMYIDRKLSGSNAVQTISRINRCCKGKKKSSCCRFCKFKKRNRYFFF